MKLSSPTIRPASTPQTSSSTAPAPSATPAHSLAKPAAPSLSVDSFSAPGAQKKMSLEMPAVAHAEGSEATRPAESRWYRAKKKVILAFSGVNYDKHAAKLGPAEAAMLRTMAQPGDVLLRRTDGTSSNMVIPGYWGHAALYAGDGKIVDAVTHDVRETDIETFCSEGDAVIVVRPKNLSKEQVASIVDYSRRQVGKPYDFDLDFKDSQRFTCTELVETAYEVSTGRDWAKGTLGSISPADFLNENFDFVWSNLGEMKK